MGPKNWNLLNSAQRLLPKLSAGQKRAMSQDDSLFGRHKGKIATTSKRSAVCLWKMNLIETPDRTAMPTRLGRKVRELLIARAAQPTQSGKS